METYENYAERRLQAIRKKREEKRRKQIKNRIYAFVTIITVCAGIAGTAYTASAKDVTITEINEFTGVQNSMTVRTRAAAVRDVLDDYDIVLTDNDRLNVPQDAKPVDDTEIVLKRGKEIRIVTANSDKKVVVTSADTNRALQEAGYQLTAQDEVTLDGGNIASSNTVEIKTLTLTEVTEDEILDYDTKYEDDPDMYVGEEKVVTEGVPGKRVKTYSVLSYPDGTEKERHFVGEKTESDPVAKVVKKGTKEKPAATTAPAATERTSDSPASATDTGSTIAGHKYSRKIVMQGTAYDTSPEENGGYTVSANGTPLRRGIVAVDPSVIPLGTKLYVVSNDGQFIYGEALADDTGGAIKGNRIDLCYPTKTECYNFGRRDVTVYILED